MRVALPSQSGQTPAPATEQMSEVEAQLQVAAEQVSPAQTDFRQPRGSRIVTRQIAIYPDPLLRLPPRPPDLKENRRDLTDLDIGINSGFEENSPFQEGIILETHEKPDRPYVKEPSELIDLLDITKIIQKFLPKQADLDKIVDVIQREVLKGTHLPITIKEIQAVYLTSTYLTDLYLYLSQNKLPFKRSAILKVEALVEKLILLDSLLFKLVTIPDREIVLLAVLEMCTDTIMTLYYSSLFAGHQGVINTYLTIGDMSFIPGLMHYLRSFIKGCHICQLTRKDKPPSSSSNLDYT